MVKMSRQCLKSCCQEDASVSGALAGSLLTGMYPPGQSERRERVMGSWFCQSPSTCCSHSLCTCSHLIGAAVRGGSILGLLGRAELRLSPPPHCCIQAVQDPGQQSSRAVPSCCSNWMLACKNAELRYSSNAGNWGLLRASISMVQAKSTARTFQ